MVFVGRRFLKITDEYTQSGKILTFLINIDDTDDIEVRV